MLTIRKAAVDRIEALQSPVTFLPSRGLATDSSSPRNSRRQDWNTVGPRRVSQAGWRHRSGYSAPSGLARFTGFPSQRPCWLTMG
jgi:hypothetical protein